MNNELIIRFWNKVNIKTPDECWEWGISSRTPFGYGSFYNGTRAIHAHRFIWEYYYGPIGSSKMFVLHSCDNPPCVNLYHLHLGNNKMNMEEKIARGRYIPSTGSLNPNSKLTEENILEIRKFIGTKSNKDIAKMFNITDAHMSSIYKGKAWKHTGKELQILPKLTRAGVKNMSKIKRLPGESITWIKEHQNDYTRENIAKMFNISKSSICNIINNKAWTHI